MATTNLNIKSLGNTTVQSGNGIPDHSSDRGSLYYNLDNNIVWQNVDNLFSWMPLIPSIYGELQLFESVTTINATSTSGFFSTSTLNWKCYNNNIKGFTKVGNTLVLNSGLTGDYRIIMHGVMVIPAATTLTYSVGIAINGTVTNTPKYTSSCSFNSTKNVGHASVILDTVLNGGDTIAVAVGNASATGTFILRDSNLIIYRIDS